MGQKPFAWYSHELCYWHDAGLGAGHVPVGPDVPPLRQYGVDPDLRRTEGFLRANGVLAAFDALEPRPATDEVLELVHPARHVAHIEAVAASGGGEAGIYAGTNYHSALAARLAAGACVEAVEAVWKGLYQRAYCFVRPPGHHAEPTRAMALCLYNNLAIAARHAQRLGAQRVLILDWDVHHGNGIQQVFYEEPDVLYISIHQEGLFPPLSGQMHEMGKGAGQGGTVNVPLPAGSGHGAYLAAIESIVTPMARTFAPDIILVAAGVDAGAHDPMGRQLCTTQTFYAMTTQLCELAADLCHGKIVFAHEGGYSNWYVPHLVQATACAIAGLPLPSDPFLHGLEHLPGQRLQPYQTRRLEQVLACHPSYTTTSPPNGHHLHPATPPRAER